jgi:hypothetical protein
VKLKSRIVKLEKQLRELKCFWCVACLIDTPLRLSFKPRDVEVIVFTCCWRCGSKFNVQGGSLRERQIDALVYSTHPVKTHTDMRARAVYTYAVNRYMLRLKLKARNKKEETKDFDYHARHQKAQQNRKELRALLRPQAKAKAALMRRVELESGAEWEWFRKRFGEMPQDLAGKTFTELEIIVFGDASQEANALDAQAAELESGATEKV